MKKIGLALGGGAVLGAAHIGVIMAFLSKFNMVSTDQIKDLIEQGYKDAKEQLKKADLPIM